MLAIFVLFSIYIIPYLITSLSKFCYFNTATSTVHCKLDYCNSLCYNLPNSQLNRTQLIRNYFAQAVVKAHKSSNASHSFKYLQWLKVNKRYDAEIAQKLAENCQFSL